MCKKLLISTLHIGQCFKVEPHSTHVTMCPHGMQANRLSFKVHIMHRPMDAEWAGRLSSRKLTDSLLRLFIHIFNAVSGSTDVRDCLFAFVCEYGTYMNLADLGTNFK